MFVPPPLCHRCFSFCTPFDSGPLLCTSKRHFALGSSIDWEPLADQRRKDIIASALGDHCGCVFPSIHINSNLQRTAWQLLLATTATSVQVCMKIYDGRTKLLTLRSPTVDGVCVPVLLTTPVSTLYVWHEETSGHPVSQFHLMGVRYMSHLQAPLAAYVWPRLKSVDRSFRAAAIYEPLNMLFRMSTRTCPMQDEIFARRGGAIGMGSFVGPIISSVSLDRDAVASRARGIF
mmetsp:Transcript_69669/g.187646  ORF Transcript_69669/g.187646 Transcript_69669/m.187646 type:complete len:233 (+) Transcript_69669:28-726(+)